MNAVWAQSSDYYFFLFYFILFYFIYLFFFTCELSHFCLISIHRVGVSVCATPPTWFNLSFFLKFAGIFYIVWGVHMNTKVRLIFVTFFQVVNLVIFASVVYMEWVSYCFWIGRFFMVWLGMGGGGEGRGHNFTEIACFVFQLWWSQSRVRWLATVWTWHVQAMKCVRLEPALAVQVKLAAPATLETVSYLSRYKNLKTIFIIHKDNERIFTLLLWIH